MKQHLLSLLFLIPVLMLPGLCLSAAETPSEQSASEQDIVVQTVALSSEELFALSSQAEQDTELHELRGGADKKFWKAFGIGAAVVLLVIIIF